MVDILKTIDQLHSWISEWEKAKSSVRKNVLRVAANSCRALVEVEDIQSDQATMLHEKVRLLYRDISTILRGRLELAEMDVVINALGSARIYYWIRILNRVPKDAFKEEWASEAWALVRRRGRLMGKLTPSLGIAYYAMVAVCPNESPKDELTENTLTRLRDGCLRDFAQLD